MNINRLLLSSVMCVMAGRASESLKPPAIIDALLPRLRKELYAAIVERYHPMLSFCFSEEEICESLFEKGIEKRLRQIYADSAVINQYLRYTGQTDVAKALIDIPEFMRTYTTERAFKSLVEFLVPVRTYDNHSEAKNWSCYASLSDFHFDMVAKTNKLTKREGYEAYPAMVTLQCMPGACVQNKLSVNNHCHGRVFNGNKSAIVCAKLRGKKRVTQARYALHGRIMVKCPEGVTAYLITYKLQGLRHKCSLQAAIQELDSGKAQMR